MVNHHQVGKAILDLARVWAFGNSFKSRLVHVQPCEMVFQRLFMCVYIPAIGLLHSQRLNGCHHQANTLRNVCRANVLNLTDLEDADAALKRIIQRDAVRMCRIL